MWLPTNDDTKTILYDTKFLKSSPGRYPAIKWTVTKIEDTATEGISMFTLAQDMFDPSKDNVELGIADYWEGAVEPELPTVEDKTVVSDLEFVYSGTPTLRAGGSYKKITLKQRVGDELVNITGAVKWSIDFPDGDPKKLETVEEGNALKVKCLPDYKLIGKTFTINAESTYGSKSLIMEVIGL